VKFGLLPGRNSQQNHLTGARRLGFGGLSQQKAHPLILPVRYL